jgi:gliding motility-associated-like protein
MKQISTFVLAARQLRYGAIPKPFRSAALLLCLLAGAYHDTQARGTEAGHGISAGEEYVATSPAGAPLLIKLSADRSLAGTRFTVFVMVGTQAVPVSELFGVGFELHYTASPYIRPVQPVQAQPGPFLQPDTYQFVRHEPQNQLFYLAVSRKRGATGQSGYGEVLSLAFEIADDAIPGQQACFSIGNIVANDPAGGAIPLESGPPACIIVDELAVEVVPNPFTPNNDGSNDQVEFKREGGIPADWVIRIMDRAGRTVRLLRNGMNLWDGRDAQNRPAIPGAYLYTISDRQRLVKRGVIALVR